MTSQLQRHNPFGLPKEPDFINDVGVKWWGINIGDQTYGTAVYVEAPNGDSDYLIIKDGEIIYGTKGVEALAWRFTILEKLRSDGESNEPKEVKHG